MTDAETTRAADDLWRLVHELQDVIGKDGEHLTTLPDRVVLARLRRLADECDPEYGRY